MGMRLSGIEGVVVHTSEEVSNALDKAMEMKDVGVVLMTELAVSAEKRSMTISSQEKRPS